MYRICVINFSSRANASFYTRILVESYVAFIDTLARGCETPRISF